MRQYLILFVLCISLCYADSMELDISISNRDIIKQDVKLVFDVNETYDNVEFATQLMPLSIQYNGEYSIEEYENLYIINFNKTISPIDNSIEFSLIYDKMIEGDKVFRTSFYPQDMDVTISLRLPRHYVLSPREPSATPKPDSISSDGQHIYLYWEFSDKDQTDIAVFYQGQESSNGIIVFSIILLMSSGIMLFYYFKKKTKKDISGILSSDEQKIVEELRKGVAKQKEIARNLDFSKSKMSKVVRKLEEKELIEKKPFFKTNTLKLSRKIR